ncbi:MAG: hypothetical protein M3298_05125, partial [Thermoproteota archaeon]|nr:hypothetical protein [Thermoproteota archaeon]
MPSPVANIFLGLPPDRMLAVSRKIGFYLMPYLTRLIKILNVSSEASLLTERFIFVPSADQMARSNIGRFMKKHSISNWYQLIEKANSDMEWYWNAVNEDLGI